jgi:DNA-binding transcriptional ArsR family regulator
MVGNPQARLKGAGSVKRPVWAMRLARVRGEEFVSGLRSQITLYQQFMKYFSIVVDEIPQQAPRWDFLTNHAHVLVCVARDPGIRLRDIAAAVGITERAAHRILSELVDEGYVVRERQGRRNRYQVKTKLPLRHPLAEEREVGDLLEVLISSTASESGRQRHRRIAPSP